MVQREARASELRVKMEASPGRVRCYQPVGFLINGTGRLEGRLLPI